MFKNLIIAVMTLSICFIVSCTSKDSFITDDKGHKQYKDSLGNFVKDDWVEINGDKYFFDMNGFLVTNKWVRNEYYVDEKGRMTYDYWFEDENGNQYYLDHNGKYARNCVLNIDGKEYGFDNNGLRAKNMVIYDGEKLYYFGNDYLRDKSEGWKNINGVYYYIDKDGGIVVNDWVEDNGKWYHFDTSGIMQVSTFIDDKYFVDENGEMVTNKSLVFGDTVYTFNNDGEFSKTIKKKKQKKNVKYKERYNNGSILIYNDYNVKDKSKKMICYCDGEEVNLNATISDNSFHFSFYLIGEELPSLNKEKKTFIKFENGETIPVFYTSNWYSVRFGAYTGITNEHNEIYEKLIALLQRDEDQKFEVSFDEVGLKLTGEICPGDFASVYAPYADKIMW